MITLHFHLIPQYKYELFHIYFTREILVLNHEQPEPRGGWTRAEQHHGSTLQYASVYTISHAVRTSGEATEDPLKLEFLSSFRCKC